MKTFDLKKKFSRKEKFKIIKKRAQYWFDNQDVEKYGERAYEECLDRSKEMMMRNKHYERFALIASVVCEKLEIPTDSDHIKMSTNSFGAHSWYIYRDCDQILRISDHGRYCQNSILIGFRDSEYDENQKLKNYPKGYYIWYPDDDPDFFSYRNKRELKKESLDFVENYLEEVNALRAFKN